MKKKNKDTFNAKVDIVMYPDTIKSYSQERNDYTELAISQCLDLLKEIDKNDKELFSLLKKNN